MKWKITVVAFLIPFLILLFSFRLVVFDVGFYKLEFEKYYVYDKFDKEIVDSSVENLITYMKFGVPLSDFFNEKEKAHMVDVKNIIQKLLLVLYLLLSIVIVSLFSSRKYFLRSIFYGGIFTLVILLLFFILSYTSFDFIFYKFHELSFNNELWKLNPEVDNLKSLLPDGFFYDALIRIIFISSITSVVFVLIGFFGLKNFKYSKKFVK